MHLKKFFVEFCKKKRKAKETRVFIFRKQIAISKAVCGQSNHIQLFQTTLSSSQKASRLSMGQHDEKFDAVNYEQP
jgi:hypothetical protein